MAGYQRRHAERKKPGLEGYVLFGSILWTASKRQNQHGREQTSRARGGVEAGVITKGQREGAVWSDGTVLYPNLVAVTRIYP